MGINGQFIDGAAGRILLVSHEPAGPARASVVVFPALADEMNKSRRLVWSLGRTLASRGIRTVVPDVFGTGDSAGEFGDARLDTWNDDMRASVAWARSQCDGPCHALLVRFGACLYPHSAEWLAEGGAHRVAAWQPEHEGSAVLRQLLRMKVMSERVTWGRSTKLATLREALLADGGETELGGYVFRAPLANAIESAGFDWDTLPVDAEGHLFDWSRPAGDAEAPESEPSAVGTTYVSGQRFWSAVEPGDHPELVAATAGFLGGDD